MYHLDDLQRARVPLAGYSSRLSARAGDSIDFKLSVENLPENDQTAIQAQLFHSVCADPNPAGPGIIEHPADQWFTPRTVKAGRQDFSPGSYGVSSQTITLAGFSAVEFQANIWPTLIGGHEQSIVACGGLTLCLTVDGNLACRLGDELFVLPSTLHARHWVRARVTFTQNETGTIEDKPTARIMLELTGLDVEDERSSRQVITREVPLELYISAVSIESSLLVAARQQGASLTNYFNGKIEAPTIITGQATQVEKHCTCWNFSENIGSTSVPGTGPLASELRLVNYPARAMTGSCWDGSEMCWRHAPGHYAAIHFHEDDIVDFNWDTTFSFTIPEHMPSGVYIMRVSDGEHEDAMPFYVCAPVKNPRNRLCVLIPTFTYVIYGNHARPDWEPSWKQKIEQWNAYPWNPAEYPAYGLSTYNYHSDGSGICHASHKRPLFNLRPGYITFANTECSGLRHFQADSHLLAWLTEQDIPFDVITDRELHNEGEAALSGYDMLMTTTHPEYHTAESLNALLNYRNHGGHLSYLGGNGFYWRVALHSEHDDAIEIRRAEDGIRAWAAEPGEYYQAFDGAYGGLWRRNGRPPQALCGVGFSAQGQFSGSYYRRKSVSDELAWLFDGIPTDIIGDFGLSGGGAAGYELDRADTRLGTPESATVVASSEKHGQDFILVPEEMLTHITTLPGPAAKDLLRADMVWFDVPGGGSVFSVGSITFCGSLPHNNFSNSVSQLLLNVVKYVLR